MRCAIVGMGNIGLALYRDLETRVGYLIGVDVDRNRVQQLRELGLAATHSLECCEDIDVWIITSSTGPDMETIYSIAEHICPKRGALVSIESTLKPGTMNEVGQIFASRGYVPGEQAFLVHIPHRIMFGEHTSTLCMPRVIAGLTRECLARGVRFYEPLVESLITVGDVRVAELSKLVENAKRYVDIAFAEAIAEYCIDQDLSFTELREAVNSKQNVHLCYTDYGIGGECLPKDIGFLLKLTESPLLEVARAEDRAYRTRLLNRIIRSGKTVLVRGLSYKPGVPDISNSPGVDLARQLERAGMVVYVEEPQVQAHVLESIGLRPCYGCEYDIVVERGLVRKEKQNG